MATSSIQAYGGSAVGGTGVRPDDIHPLETYSGSTQTNTYDPLVGDTWHIRRLFVTIDGVPTFTYAPLGASDQFLEVETRKVQMYECTEPSWPNLPTMFGSVITGHDVIIRQLLSDGVTYKEWKLLGYVQKDNSPAQYSMVFGLVDGFTVEKVSFDSTDNFATFTVSDFTTTIPPRATIAEPYSPYDVSNYHKGTLVYYEDGLYVCKTDTPSNHWEVSEWDSTTVADELERRADDVFECTEPSWPSGLAMWNRATTGHTVVIRQLLTDGVNFEDWKLVGIVDGTSPARHALIFTHNMGFTNDRIIFESADLSTWTRTTYSNVSAPRGSVAGNYTAGDYTTYHKDTLVYRNDNLYRCKTDTPSDHWVGSEWELTTIEKELARKGEGGGFMDLKYIKSGVLQSYTLTGNTPVGTITLSSDTEFQIARLDNGGSQSAYLSAAVENTIRKARISLGGAGKVLSRSQLSGKLVVDVKIDASESESGSEELISTFILKIGEWGEWEDKKIPLDFSGVTAEDWASAFRTAMPVRLVIDHSTSQFTIEDFNILEDFVGESLSIYLELGVEADKTTNSGGNTLID
jgi:hypothetical protein